MYQLSFSRFTSHTDVNHLCFPHMHVYSIRGLPGKRSSSSTPAASPALNGAAVRLPGQIPEVYMDCLTASLLVSPAESILLLRLAGDFDVFQFWRQQHNSPSVFYRKASYKRLFVRNTHKQRLICTQSLIIFITAKQWRPRR